MRTLKVHGRYYQLYPPDHFKGHIEVDFDVNFDRSALLVVDVYGYGFTQNKNAQYHPSFVKETNQIWDNITLNYIRPTIEAARLASMPVIYSHNSAPNIEVNRSEYAMQLGRTLQANIEELLSERPGLVDPLEYKTKESKRLLDIAPAVTPKPGDYYIRKNSHSGFKYTYLDRLLRNLDIKTLFCMGFDASMCLLLTMVDAMELNYEIVLIRDACRAIEIPEDEEIGYCFTDRIIKWIETIIGRSITTQHFVDLMASIEPKAAEVRVG